MIKKITKKKLSEIGVKFFTNENHHLQLSSHYYQEPRETRIHGSKPILKFIYVIKGKVTIELSKINKKYKSVTLNEGDGVLIQNVIHKFISGKSTNFIEVKQGPYERD